jgi:hypothetical protein
LAFLPALSLSVLCILLSSALSLLVSTSSIELHYHVVRPSVNSRVVWKLRFPNNFR